MCFLIIEINYLLAQILTAEQLFRDLPFDTILQSDLTISKKYETQIVTSKINFLVVRFQILLFR
jgi:hypothetical protein